MADSLDTAAIAARVEAATPGPWSAREGWNLMPPMRYEIAAPDVEEWSVVEAGDNDWGPAGGVNKKADADFIAHARQDIPALLAALGRAEADRDEAYAHDESVTVTTGGALRIATERLNAAEARLAAAEAERDEWRDSFAELSARYVEHAERMDVTEARAERYEKALRRIAEWDMIVSDACSDAPWARNLIADALGES